jgi:hypothetical protein
VLRRVQSRQLEAGRAISINPGSIDIRIQLDDKCASFCAHNGSNVSELSVRPCFRHMKRMRYLPAGKWHELPAGGLAPLCHPMTRRPSNAERARASQPPEACL